MKEIQIGKSDNIQTRLAVDACYDLVAILLRPDGSAIASVQQNDPGEGVIRVRQDGARQFFEINVHPDTPLVCERLVLAAYICQGTERPYFCNRCAPEQRQFFLGKMTLTFAGGGEPVSFESLGRAAVLGEIHLSYGRDEHVFRAAAHSFADIDALLQNCGL